MTTDLLTARDGTAVAGDGPERPTCVVTACVRHTDINKFPMCADHWLMVPDAVRQRILELREEWPVSHQVALALAAEAIDTHSPHWNRGGWVAPASRVDRNAAVLAERASNTWQSIRRWHRKRLGADYAQRVQPYRDELVELRATVRAPNAISVALAMVRGGHGTPGYDPLWIAAALDVDEGQGN